MGTKGVFYHIQLRRQSLYGAYKVPTFPPLSAGLCPPHPLLQHPLLFPLGTHHGLKLGSISSFKDILPSETFPSQSSFRFSLSQRLLHEAFRGLSTSHPTMHCMPHSPGLSTHLPPAPKSRVRGRGGGGIVHLHAVPPVARRGHQIPRLE